jgi:hypothetical protein
MSKSNVVPIPKAGYPIAAWCEATNISRATFYTLPLEIKPNTVKIGKRHIVIEAPGDFLRRVQSLNAKAA